MGQNIQLCILCATYACPLTKHRGAFSGKLPKQGQKYPGSCGNAAEKHRERKDATMIHQYSNFLSVKSLAVID